MVEGTKAAYMLWSCPAIQLMGRCGPVSRTFVQMMMRNSILPVQRWQVAALAVAVVVAVVLMLGRQLQSRLYMPALSHIHTHTHTPMHSCSRRL